MFWSRNIVDEETADWICETFRWLISELGPKVFFDEIRLIMPTREFFDAPGGTDHATAEIVFAQVKRHMGMADRPCRLIRQDDDPDSHGLTGLALQRAVGGPDWTSSENGDTAQVTYNPGLMKSPIAFVDVLARALSYNFLVRRRGALPRSKEMLGLTTDLASICAGFGIFQLEGGMVAEGFQATYTWHVTPLILSELRNRGWLSLEQRSFALALFLGTKDIRIETALPFLSSDKAWLLKKAAKTLRRQPERVAALKRLAASGEFPCDPPSR